MTTDAKGEKAMQCRATNQVTGHSVEARKVMERDSSLELPKGSSLPTT